MTFFPTTSNPADLWQDARCWLADALKRFRGPAGIAATRARRTLAAIRRRLRALESLVSKLLLVKAAALVAPVPPVPPASSSPGRSRSDFASAKPGRQQTERSHANARSTNHNAGWKPALQHHNEDSADPSTWRVRFHPRVPRERARQRRAAPLCPKRADAPTPPDPRARLQRQAHALARRFEAVARVIANPRHAVAVLARKLAALGAAAHAAACRIAQFTPPRRRRERTPHARAVVAAYDAIRVLHADTS